MPCLVGYGLCAPYRSFIDLGGDEVQVLARSPVPQTSTSIARGVQGSFALTARPVLGSEAAAVGICAAVGV